MFSLLYSQVTRQTQQLTTAFERQSQHISGLLVELQEKESALLSQGEELQHFKQELNALKPQKEQNRPEEQKVKTLEDGETQNERLGFSGLQQTEEERVDTLVDLDSNAEREAGRPKVVISDADSEEAKKPYSGPVKSAEAQRHLDSSSVVEDTEWSQDEAVGNVAQLLTLRQENQLLKHRTEIMTSSDLRKSPLQTDIKNQEVTLEQSITTGQAAQPCSMEQRALSDVTTVGPESLQQNERRIGNEGKKDETTLTEGQCKEVSQLHIDHLERQVRTQRCLYAPLSNQVTRKIRFLIFRMSHIF